MESYFFAEGIYRFYVLVTFKLVLNIDSGLIFCISITGSEKMNVTWFFEWKRTSINVHEIP